jgi:hypothetical protein
VNALTAGLVIALLVVGYPLYQLVTAGTLDATSALLRGGVVAAGCAAGITAIVRLALRWEAEGDHARKRKLTSLYSEMEDAVTDGTLHPEDGPDAPRTGPEK